MQQTEIQKMLEALLEIYRGRKNKLAADLDASEVSLNYWLKGEREPIPVFQDAIIRCAKQHKVKI
jgi:hypothetical protein